MFKNMKIGTKILIAFTLVAVVAVGLVGFFAFTTGSSTLEEESFNKLTAVREMKASQIEDYFHLIENQVITLSEDRMIIEAMRDVDNGLHTVDLYLNVSDSEMESMDEELERYYEEEFLPRLIPNAGRIKIAARGIKQPRIIIQCILRPFLYIFRTI